MGLLRSRPKKISLNDIAYCHRGSIFVTESVSRGLGRTDFFLSPSWVEAARSLPAVAKLHTEVNRFIQHKSILVGAKQVWPLMCVEPKAPAQSWHVDRDVNGHAYFTFLVPMTNDGTGSGTELDRDYVWNTLGDVLIFSGNRVHRGTAHPGNKKRIFLYVAVFTGVDPN